MTNEKIETMIELRKEGMSYAEIGERVGYSDKTVAHYTKGIEVPSIAKGRRMGSEQIEKMKELRDKGLSNTQIAIEMGITNQTVVRHIGVQKRGNRANYGSIVAHAEGESFLPDTSNFPCLSNLVSREETDGGWLKEAMAKQEAEKRQSRPALMISSTVVTYDGNSARYTIDSNEGVYISDLQGKGTLAFTFREFNRFLEELMELVDKMPVETQKKQAS